jgi:hypothetical protein
LPRKLSSSHYRCIILLVAEETEPESGNNYQFSAPTFSDFSKPFENEEENGDGYFGKMHRRERICMYEECVGRTRN